MKKLLAILLAAVMALSCGATALAAEEPTVYSYTVSDFYIVADNEEIDLSGLAVTLDAAESDGIRSGRMQVKNNGETLGEFTFTITPEGLIALHLDGTTLGVKDYGIDLKARLSRGMRSVLDKLVDILQSVDTDSAAQTIINDLLWTPPAVEEEPAAEEEPEPEVEEPAEEPAVTVEMPSISVDFEGIIDALSECVTTETTNMGGEEYGPDGSAVTIPDGEYTTTNVVVDTDTIASMLDMVSVNGQSLGIGDALKSSGMDLTFTVTKTAGEAAKLGQFNFSASGGGYLYTVGGGVTRVESDEGARTTVSYGTSSGSMDDPSVTSASAKITAVPADGSFAAAPVDAGSLVMLSDMTPEEAMTELTQSFVTLLTDMLAPLGEEVPAE